MNTLRTVMMTVAMSIAMPWAAAAQDAHYWNLQYGTRGELLGGVVVGSAVDLSATFYNPGSYAFVKDPSAILTASVFQIQTLGIVDESGDSQSITSKNIGPAPGIIAGRLPMRWFGGTMAYSFLTRQQLDFRMQARDGVVIGQDVPGDTLSIGGEVILDQEMTEQWGGLTWARPVSERWSVGTTVYGTYRGQRTRIQQIVEAIGGGGYGATLIDIVELDYTVYRALAKFGVSAQFENATFGLAFTTPGVNVLGSGSVVDNRTIVGDVDLDGASDSEATIGYGEDLDAEYRSPMSIAGGGSYSWDEFTLHASVEWFDAVEEYTLVESSELDGGPGVTTVVSRFDGSLKSVVNFGVGLEKRFSDRGTSYVSFITDRSARRNVDGIATTLSTWDIYHLNGGVALVIKGTELTLGGGFAWGSNPVLQQTTGAGSLPPTVIPSEVEYSRIKIVIGFAL